MTLTTTLQTITPRGVPEVPPPETGTATPPSAPAAGGGRGESSSGELLMIEGYVFLWLALMAWLLFLWRKQARLHERLDGLEKAIAATEAGKAGRPTAKEGASS